HPPDPGPGRSVRWRLDVHHRRRARRGGARRGSRARRARTGVGPARVRPGALRPPPRSPARVGRGVVSEGKLLVVAQRYGDVAGGAEWHARELVKHLAPHFHIKVATTTATDYWTWKNDLPIGEELVDGVPVRRFPADR